MLFSQHREQTPDRRVDGDVGQPGVDGSQHQSAELVIGGAEDVGEVRRGGVPAFGGHVVHAVSVTARRHRGKRRGFSALEFEPAAARSARRSPRSPTR